MNHQRRRFMWTLGSLAIASCSPSILSAQETGGQQLTQPVFRVSRANNLPRKQATPLDEALEMAREGLTNIRTNIDDFTAVIVKRERINGSLGEYEYMFAKIRNRKVNNGSVQTPFSVYLAFLKPTSVKGREVLYVEGRNDNKLTAHEGGFKGRFLPTVSLQPTSGLAMRGQRYPLTDIGIENLIIKLIERGETARQYPDIECSFRNNAKIKDRVCTVIELTQPTRRTDLDFHKAQIFIDDEMNIPLRYVAYDWPSRKGAPLEVIEEYTYLDVKTNVGLEDSDFDAHNADYNFH